MRILFLDHPQHTQGTWTLHQALGRVLGWESVIDFPYKEVFRGNDHHVVVDPDYAPLYEVARSKRLPSGIPPFAPGEPLVTEELISNKSVGDHHRCAATRRYSWNEVVSAIGAFDLVVLGNSHRVPTITLALLRDRCGRDKLPPIVYLDAGERDEFNAHWWHVFRPEMCFKQILTPAIAANPNASCVLHPLPLANGFVTDAEELRSYVDNPKTRDIVFPHGITWGPREGVMQTVRDWLKKTNACGQEKQLLRYFGRNDYFSAIASSRMSLSIRGSGRDTTRYWEIPALESLLVADGTMGCVHPFPFRDGETAAFYTSLEELTSKLDFYHRNEEARQVVARKGRAWVEKYHSLEARALFFLAMVQEHLGIRCSEDQQNNVDGWLRRLDWSSKLPDWSGPVVGYEPA